MIHWLLGRVRVLGIGYLALVVGAVWLSWAIFTKKFAEYDELTLQTSNIGLQLPQRADVKIDGMIVGEVLDMSSTGDGAEVTLGIYPDQTRHIPAEVTGRIVPKTLFGEKYVALVRPEGAEATATAPIEPGTVIERTEVPVEVEQVLSDLYPLLRTVRPADLSYTLNALAMALDGRGDQIGEAMVTADGYLKKLNPQLPALVEDLRLTADTADLWSDLLPEVSEVLENTMVTTGTLHSQEDRLRALFGEVTRFSNTTQRFLATNEQSLIRVGAAQEPILRLLAEYSPQFPCLTAGIDKAADMNAETFRDFTLHIVLETLPHQPRAYTADDRPAYVNDPNGTNFPWEGPNCLNLPNSPYGQANPFPFPHHFDTGVDGDVGKSSGGPLPAHRVAPRLGAEPPAALGSPTYVGSGAEEAVLKTMLAPGLGLDDPEQVDDLGVLLVGPMARGATVSLGEPAATDQGGER